ncbi:serine hydrolase domain-containing protein [Streptomyces scabiei]|uniref:serine hydrolase domain-containing protein n=1 Tax=Streptomyces scabiei TaxID=1930 RepID=UPI0004E7A968|nr:MULTISPECIES: serine hydrolase domain-containing protein [Streptomyces]MBP5862434.1 beta-lactamase family protein [Streptomyces sp. LBUM 1484]MBP5868625.1 beta-lactamase family protein [Streptomyces sp. LBUM 1485]KFG10267.1 peptidase [Streptomyces scabiei]MBP5892269.1 beta-lactamase family protein [Streptomyces sp. LBUM 1481]MBP5900905.1 beta-lactamase family protein [Streptomyces sp. LBUM 1488]
MKRATRTLLAAACVLGTVTGPAALPAAASPSPGGTANMTAPPHVDPGTARTDPATDPATAAALEAAVAGLPTADATAALVRVGGTDGVWRGSSGVHDLTSGRAADPRARFRVGSVTKVFTAAVVLGLAAEGKVDLDRSVRAYLPDLIPASYGGVTVRQLLDHTHGIPAADFPGSTVEEWYANRFLVHDPEAMVRSATAKEREFAPGERQHYLNIGYTIAGLLVERVTGDSYERQLARRVLKPLGLRDTYAPGADPRITGPHNHGYQRMTLDDGTTGLRDVTVWGVTDGWAAGDLVSTTADLERFTDALFGGRIVPRGPLLEAMFTVPRVAAFPSGKPAEYAVGLARKVLGGREVWGKTGGRWGYNAAIASTRDGSRTLVYSVNSTDAKGQDVSRVALGVMVAAYGSPS